ncbi:MAG: hypothetical protein ACJ8AT_18265 [Hyalangium sp.]|uniref:hypothetical protein n=1 Tax=Hyalangium sp. TaxID=2028555 RepID=UPI0038998E41
MADKTTTEQESQPTSQEGKPPKAAQPQKRELGRAPSEDKFLQMLCGFLDRTYPEAKWGLGITFSTGGMLVSGTLISTQWYFEQLTEQLSKMPPPGGTIAIGTEKFRESVMKQIGETKGKEENTGEGESADEGEKKEPYSAHYAHLMNVKFFVPGERPIESNKPPTPLWRGRITEIQGFMLASLSAS